MEALDTREIFDRTEAYVLDTEESLYRMAGDTVRFVEQALAEEYPGVVHVTAGRHGEVAGIEGDQFHHLLICLDARRLWGIAM